MQKIGMVGIVVVFFVSTYAVVFGNHHIDEKKVLPVIENRIKEEIVIKDVERRVFSPSMVTVSFFGGKEKNVYVTSNLWHQYAIKEVTQ